MSEREIINKNNISMLLGKLGFRYDKKMNKDFWEALSTQTAVDNELDKLCYEAILNIIRNAMTNGKLERSEEESIKAVLAVWNDCLDEDKCVNVASLKNRLLKITTRVSSERTNIDVVKECIDDTCIIINKVIKNRKEKYKGNAIQTKKLQGYENVVAKLQVMNEQLENGVVFTTTSEASVCRKNIIEQIKLIRKKISIGDIVTEDEMESLQKEVDKWCRSTDQKYRKNSLEEEDINDDLNYEIKYEDIEERFNSNIDTVKLTIEEKEKILEEATSKIEQLKMKYKELEIAYKNGIVSKKAFNEKANDIFDEIEEETSKSMPETRSMVEAQKSILTGVLSFAERLFRMVRIGATTYQERCQFIGELNLLGLIELLKTDPIKARTKLNEMLLKLDNLKDIVEGGMKIMEAWKLTQKQVEEEKARQKKAREEFMKEETSKNRPEKTEETTEVDEDKLLEERRRRLFGESESEEKTPINEEIISEETEETTETIDSPFNKRMKKNN